MGFNRETASKKARAIQLRKNGKSYGEILRELDISSKGTLSNWFRDITLSPSSKKRLQRNIQLATKRGLLEFNKKRSKQILQENEVAYAEGIDLIGSLTKREILLIGSALYWGEGAKLMRDNRHPILDFANSDHKMVTIYMRFLREVLQIDNNRIRAGIHLYAKADEEEARRHWSQATGLPHSRFFITKQVSKASRGVRPQNRLPFGTVSIRVSDRKLFHKVIGMIEGIGKVG